MDREADALGRARRGVVVAVGSERRDAPLRQEGRRRWDAGRPWPCACPTAAARRGGARDRCAPAGCRPGPTRTPCSRSAASRSSGNTCSPGSSHGTPRRRGTSSSTPRPTRPSSQDVDRAGLGALRGHRRPPASRRRSSRRRRRGRRRRCDCGRRCGSRPRRSPWRSARSRSRCPGRSASSCGDPPAPGCRCASSVSSGRLSVTVTPLRTSRAAVDDPLRREVVERAALRVLAPATPVARPASKSARNSLLAHQPPAAARGLSNSPSSMLRWLSV